VKVDASTAPREVRVAVITSLRTALEEFTLLLLPHGGQRTARRNAWRAAYDGRQSAQRRAEAAVALTALGGERPRPIAVGASR
jgi:hypothetical protein